MATKKRRTASRCTPAKRKTKKKKSTQRRGSNRVSLISLLAKRLKKKRK